MNYQPSVNEVLHYLKSHQTHLPPTFDGLDAQTRSKRHHTLREYAKRFILKDGILYYVGGKKKHATIKVLFTRQEIDEVLDDIHTQGYSESHLGTKRTQALIAERFYWRSMTNDVKAWVSSCPKCHKQRKQELLRNTPKVCPIYSLAPWDIIGLDLLGPLPCSADGFRYVLIVTCLFSKWVEAESMEDNSSEAIFKILSNVFCRWGFPQRIITDYESEFDSAQLNEMFSAKFGVKNLIAVAFRSESANQQETADATIERILSKLVNETNESWVECLSQACWEIRSSLHESTNRTPFEVMFQRKPRLASDLASLAEGSVLLGKTGHSTVDSDMLPKGNRHAELPHVMVMVRDVVPLL